MADMRDSVELEGPCVVMAAPGMLQNGTSRDVFEKWATDSKNGVIMTGYSVHGTLADKLKNKHDCVDLDGRIVNVRCSFESISFSAHSDFNQTWDFIRKLRVPNVVLVHGQKDEMHMLKSKIEELMPSIAVFAPAIQQSVQLTFPTTEEATACGQLANDIVAASTSLGVVPPTTRERVVKGFDDDPDEQQKPSAGGLTRDRDAMEVGNLDVEECVMVLQPPKAPILMYPADIPNATSLQVSTLTQTLQIHFSRDFACLVTAVRHMYEETETTHLSSFTVASRVNCFLITSAGKPNAIKLEWQSSRLSDMIADSISYIALDLESELNADAEVARTKSRQTPCDNSVISVIMGHLEQKFGHVDVELSHDDRQTDTNDDATNVVLKLSVALPAAS
eukprot:Selendium_serpulae@DN5984_c0_g2_i3.p1